MNPELDFENGFLPNYSSVFANVHQPGATTNMQDNSFNMIVVVLAPLGLALFGRRKERQK